MSQFPSHCAESRSSGKPLRSLLLILGGEGIVLAAQRSLGTHIKQPAQLRVSLLGQPGVSLAPAGLADAHVQPDVSDKLIGIGELLSLKTRHDCCSGDRADA